MSCDSSPVHVQFQTYLIKLELAKQKTSFFYQLEIVFLEGFSLLTSAAAKFIFIFNTRKILETLSVQHFRNLPGFIILLLRIHL